MQITKQDIQILLSGGGQVEKFITKQIGTTPQKIISKQPYPALIIIIAYEDFFIGFNMNEKIPSAFFNRGSATTMHSEIVGDKHILILHKGQELYLSSSNLLPIPFQIAVFSLPQYILDAPSIKQVEIQNTFNIPLEEQNVR